MRMESIGFSFSTFLPSIKMLPSSGSCAPEITLIRVDLPHPFSPARQCTSPLQISRSTPFNARTPPKDFLIPSNFKNTSAIYFFPTFLLSAHRSANNIALFCCLRNDVLKFHSTKGNPMQGAYECVSCMGFAL